MDKAVFKEIQEGCNKILRDLWYEGTLYKKGTKILPKEDNYEELVALGAVRKPDPIVVEKAKNKKPVVVEAPADITPPEETPEEQPVDVEPGSTADII